MHRNFLTNLENTVIFQHSSLLTVIFQANNILKLQEMEIDLTRNSVYSAEIYFDSL